MYLSADSPTRSLRYAPTPDGDLLIVGGNGHTVGRGGATQPRVADLIDWTRRHFPGGEVTHTWSAQDYHSADQLPVVGGLLPTDDRILIASGYDKWGMTNAVAAAAVIAARIDGEPPAWAATFDPWALSRAPRSALPALELNAGVAVEMVKGWVGPVVGFRSSSPAEGEGRVQPGFRFLEPCARSTGGPTGVGSVSPSRGPRPLERQRTQLGLSAARLPLRRGRPGPRRARHAGSECVGLRFRPTGYVRVMDQSRAPLLEALQEYHRLDRYGFSPPGHRQGRGADARVRDVLGDEPFRATSWRPEASTIACRRRAICRTPRS